MAREAGDSKHVPDAGSFTQKMSYLYIMCHKKLPGESVVIEVEQITGW